MDWREECQFCLCTVLSDRWNINNIGMVYNSLRDSLVRPSQCLIFFVHWDWAFLMLDSGITSTAKTKWKAGLRNLWRIHNLYSPLIGDESNLTSFSRKEGTNLLHEALAIARKLWLMVWPRNLVGPVEMFLVEPSTIGKVALLSTFLPSYPKDTHFEGFSVKSRSEQCLWIDCRAATWSSLKEENTDRSSAKPFTLCDHESFILDRLTVPGGLGRYNLPFPRAGNHLVSERLIVSSVFPYGKEL